MFYHSCSSRVRSRVVLRPALLARIYVITESCWHHSFRHRSFRVYLNVCWGKLYGARRPLDRDWRTSECHKPFCLHCTLQHSIRNKHTLQKHALSALQRACCTVGRSLTSFWCTLDMKTSCVYRHTLHNTHSNRIEPNELQWKTLFCSPWFWC